VNLDWNDEPLCQHFFRGLKPEVKDKVLSPTDFIDLNSLIESAIKWDNLLYQRRKDPNNNNKSTDRFNITNRQMSNNRSWNQGFNKPQWNGPQRHNNIGSGPAPMEVDSIRGPLTQGEKDRRRQNNLCLYCGTPGHRALDCRKRPIPPQARKFVASIDEASDQAKGSPQ
jgi:hypothetical protein